MSDGEAYAAYWSGLTGRPAEEIYIPLALRDDRDGECPEGSGDCHNPRCPATFHG